MPAKSPLLLTASGVVKMTTPTSQHKSAKNFTVLVVDKISITTFTHQNRCTQNGHDHFIPMKRLYNIEVTGSIAAYIRTGDQIGNQSRQSSGTYVHCEASVNSFICGLATASIPIKPHTRRPAELVIVLQCSRLYLPQAATSASLKLRRLSAVRLFSSHHIR